MPDPGVQFVSGLSDVNALLGESAELSCKLSSDQCEGNWYKDGKKVSIKKKKMTQANISGGLDGKR